MRILFSFGKECLQDFILTESPTTEKRRKIWTDTVANEK